MTSDLSIMKNSSGPSLNENRMKKLFAVGDIHGRLDKLKQLMGKIEARPESDTLIFLGDYIDRGPDSKGVVDYILELKKGFRNLYCLMGNHEKMLLDYLQLRRHNRELYLLNGGIETLKSYGLSTDGPLSAADLPEKHLSFFRSLLYYYETEDYIFVHAGLRPGRSLAMQDIDDLIWIREDFFHTPCEFEKTVVFGHTPFGHPYTDSCRIGIDTGAVYSGVLTCLELPNKIFHQV